MPWGLHSANLRPQLTRPDDEVPCAIMVRRERTSHPCLGRCTQSASKSFPPPRAILGGSVALFGMTSINLTGPCSPVNHSPPQLRRGGRLRRPRRMVVAWPVFLLTYFARALCMREWRSTAPTNAHLVSNRAQESLRSPAIAEQFLNIFHGRPNIDPKSAKPGRFGAVLTVFGQFSQSIEKSGQARPSLSNVVRCLADV